MPTARRHDGKNLRKPPKVADELLTEFFHVHFVHRLAFDLVALLIHLAFELGKSGNVDALALQVEDFQVTRILEIHDTAGDEYL